nr:Chain B, peptide, LEACAF from Lactotransferrin [Bos taurus]3U72_B Chain B, C-terminal peptide of Lactotransferrin [Bos taurus]3U8Q_B Chain B, C-terminal peptide of Lactotransferrin [Bos taurus]3UGW_B Chain B, C-terminal peptide from Lactotransferrin [Bos taurus]3UK4_B Chain B, C-terminal peptide from Lactotransferrin [Bos taurus]3USD_B Chain B, C-terminal peptide of Lactotransferrin [Bos taurus]3V5A_B Chain B, C-TERMINAL PEPTIDE OF LACTOTRANSFERRIN [Bos taurus]3VDF_B Chain B, C-TERMINAL P
LEACAF